MWSFSKFRQFLTYDSSPKIYIFLNWLDRKWWWVIWRCRTRNGRGASERWLGCIGIQRQYHAMLLLLNGGLHRYLKAILGAAKEWVCHMHPHPHVQGCRNNGSSREVTMIIARKIERKQRCSVQVLFRNALLRHHNLYNYGLCVTATMV